MSDHSPDFRRAAPLIPLRWLDLSACEIPLVQQFQGDAYAFRLPVSPKGFPYGRAGHPVLSSSAQRPENVVGYRISQGGAEDVTGGFLGPLPYRYCCQQVRFVYRVRAFGQCEGKSEPQTLSLGPRRNRAEQSGVPFT